MNRPVLPFVRGMYGRDRMWRMSRWRSILVKRRDL